VSVQNIGGLPHEGKGENGALTIVGISVRRDADGRFNLNDLHRAAGGEKKHQPSDWLRLQQTLDLRSELEMEKPGFPGIQAKQGLGTFAVRELIYAYAMWISPSFHLQVIRAFDGLVTGQMAAPAAPESDDITLSRALLIASGRLDEAKKQIADLTPKAAGYDRIASADGSLCITDGAKALQIRPKDLFDYLDRNGWTYRRPGSDHRCAYQARIASGDLIHKVTTVLRPDGTEKVTEQVRITPKGLAKLSKLFPPMLDIVA